VKKKQAIISIRIKFPTDCTNPTDVVEEFMDTDTRIIYSLMIDKEIFTYVNTEQKKQPLMTA